MLASPGPLADRTANRANACCSHPRGPQLAICAKGARRAGITERAVGSIMHVAGREAPGPPGGGPCAAIMVDSQRGRGTSANAF